MSPDEIHEADTRGLPAIADLVDQHDHVEKDHPGCSGGPSGEPVVVGDRRHARCLQTGGPTHVRPRDLRLHHHPMTASGKSHRPVPYTAGWTALPASPHRPRACSRSTPTRLYSAFGVVVGTDIRGCSSTVGRRAGPSTVRQLAHRTAAGQVRWRQTAALSGSLASDLVGRVGRRTRRRHGLSRIHAALRAGDQDRASSSSPAVITEADAEYGSPVLDNGRSEPILLARVRGERRADRRDDVERSVGRRSSGRPRSRLRRCAGERRRRWRC